MQTAFKVVYFSGMVIEIVLRVPYALQGRKTEKTDRRISFSERTVLAALLLGTFLLPLGYALAPWLRFADYSFPPGVAVALGILGVPVLSASVWVLWRAHCDLGANWSPSLEIASDQRLVTWGIYGMVRHPMYASLLLWGVAQALLLQNWIAGPASLVVFLLGYFVRVPREERMMLDHFGDEYRAYSCRTGRVLPRFGERSPRGRQEDAADEARGGTRTAR